MTWDYRRFGTVADPIRQSALGAFASQDGCGRRYRYERDDEAAGLARSRTASHWRPTLGTAVHATIERALDREPMTSAVLEGRMPSHARIDTVLREEMERAAEGLPIDWQDARPEAELVTARWMVLGALRSVAARARRVIAVEAPFLAQIDDYHLSGTIDLVYEPRTSPPGSVAIADWKTGERKPHQVVLDHGYQTAIYAYALASGVLFPGTDRELRPSAHPSEIHIVHLRSYADHERRRAVLASVRDCPGTSADLMVLVARRGWEISTHSIAGALRALRDQGLVETVRVGRQVVYRATASTAEPREDGVWLASHRSEHDAARLRVSLKTIAGTVRMGRFVEQLGEQCGRCPYRAQCLGDGHVSASVVRAANRALDGLDLDGLDDLGGDAA